MQSHRQDEADREAQPADGSREVRAADLVAEQAANGYTLEELDLLVEPMITQGKEAIGSMGTDTPIALAIPGYSLHTELEFLVRAGVPFRAAIHAYANDLNRYEIEHAIRKEIHVRLEEDPAYFRGLRDRLLQICRVDRLQHVSGDETRRHRVDSDVVLLTHERFGQAVLFAQDLFFSRPSPTHSSSQLAPAGPVSRVSVRLRQARAVTTLLRTHGVAR